MLKIGNWNVEWSAKKSVRTPHIQQILQSLDADILCVTEGFAYHLPNTGHLLKSRASGTKQDKAGGHKGLLWSKNAWCDVDTLGSPDLPEGRFLSGITETPIGEVRVIGVCIPYANYRNYERWGKQRLKHSEGKARYLRVLHKLLKDSKYQARTIIIGDYNLAIPKQGNYPPTWIDDLRQEVFADWVIPTSGTKIPFFSPIQKKSVVQDKNIIDHIAHTPDLSAKTVSCWSRFLEDGTRLSDHNGVYVEMQLPK